jgi:glycosyltransferase 2 family protein
MNKLFRRLIFGLVLGVGVYACVAITVGVDQLVQSLATFRYWLFLPVLALSCGNYVLRYFKWHLYLKQLEIHLPAGTSLSIFLSGLSMTITPGKIGELLKAYLVREAVGVPMSKTAPVVIAERVTDLLALILLMLSGFFTFRRFEEVLIAGGPLVVVFLVVISSRRLSLALLSVIARLPGLSRLSQKLLELYESTAALFLPWPLFLATVLSLVAWFCECTGFYLVLGGFPRTHAPLLLAVFIYSATTLGGVVSPGGLGITDGAMTAFLNLTATFSLATSGAATLLIRLCTLWLAVLVGVCSLLLFLRSARVGDELPPKKNPEENARIPS